MNEQAELRRFRVGLVAVLALVAVAWGVYQAVQPAYDPRHDDPGFDSAYYLEWSDSILSGVDPAARFEGAFYRAPLYAYGISALRGILGASVGVIRWLQLVLALAATATLAHAAFRWAGAPAGIGTALVLGAYHPWLFFSSRVLVEGVAISLLALAVALIPCRSPRWTGLAAAALALATLARPNLLLVGIVWIAAAWWSGERRKAVILALVLAVTLLPVTAWNFQRSGHVVPVSANGGLTLYHGNGPGALGVFTSVAGMGAAIESQRAEATRAAQRLTGRPMDAVEADRYWGRQAVRERLAHPLGSAVLVWNRALLTLGNEEIALDEAPGLDPNPWHRAMFVPFAMIVALAAAGCGCVHRDRASIWIWTAIAACLATPLMFYASSRYRLPFAILLAVPAGAGLARVLEGNRRAVVTALVVGALSVGVPLVAGMTMPYSTIIAQARADGEAELASAFHDRAGLASDETERARWAAAARAALDRGRGSDARSAKVWFYEGMIARDQGRPVDAEKAWLRAWQDGQVAPPRVAAAANLGGIWIRSGRARAAERLLREALRLEPLDETCRHNLIAAHLALGEMDRARQEIAEARRLGVPVDPELDALSRSGG